MVLWVSCGCKGLGKQMRQRSRLPSFLAHASSNILICIMLCTFALAGSKTHQRPHSLNWGGLAAACEILSSLPLVPGHPLMAVSSCRNAQRFCVHMECEVTLLCPLRGGARHADDDERTGSMAEARSYSRKMAKSHDYHRELLRKETSSSSIRKTKPEDRPRSSMAALKSEIADKCVAILRQLGGTADLKRIVERWRSLYQKDFVSRDGQVVYRSGEAISFESAMLMTGKVVVSKDRMRPHGTIYSLRESSMGGRNSDRNSAAGGSDLSTRRAPHYPRQPREPEARADHRSHGRYDSAMEDDSFHQHVAAAPRNPTGSNLMKNQYPEYHDEKQKQNNFDTGREFENVGSAEKGELNSSADTDKSNSILTIPKHLLLHKTRLCREFMQKGSCQFEKICSFAHGRDELRSPFDTAKLAAILTQTERPAVAASTPVSSDTSMENSTFSGKIARVMASDSYPPDAHFCISESSPGQADVFISRRMFPVDLWMEVQRWWNILKGQGNFEIQVVCHPHKKGSNNWRALSVSKRHFEPDPTSQALDADDETSCQARNCSIAEDATGPVSPQAEKSTNPFSPEQLQPPKIGHIGTITSSGKNFSFADDCIYIKNELRDACGIKGLWVGDIVKVDAAFNIVRRNWVATSVALVQRNNTGYLLLQEAIERMQPPHQDVEMRKSKDENEAQQGPSFPDAPATDPTGSAENLSAILKDPEMLQALITVLQQQKKPSVVQTSNQQEGLNSNHELFGLAVDLQRQNAENSKNEEDDEGAQAKRRPWNYKSELCANFLKLGRCKYMERCLFAHSQEELRMKGAMDTNSSSSNKRDKVSQDDDSEVGTGGRKKLKSAKEDPLANLTEAELMCEEIFVTGLDKRFQSQVDEAPGDVTSDCSKQDDLKMLFSKYGEVKEARLIFDHSKSPPVFKGYGFVRFVDPADSLKAIRALNQKRYGRRFLKVIPAASSAQTSAEVTLTRSPDSRDSSALQEDLDSGEGEQESMMADDYLDPQKETPAAAGQQQDDAFKEIHLTAHKEHDGPMHACMMQGLPNYMEDNFAALVGCGKQVGGRMGDQGEGAGAEGIKKRELSLFGVFDGHNGYRGSLYVREMLLHNIASFLEDETSLIQVQSAIRQAYIKTDEDFNSLGVRDGCCVVTVAVSPSHLIAANAGDSRAVLALKATEEEEMGGAEVRAVDLTEDHKPGRPDEQARIESAGGFVVELGVPRVMGYLAVSRAIGDAELKQFVIAEPEIHVKPRDAAEMFVLLATDGLWDVMSSQEA
eukprot:542250-Hanusia_phi.AAC.1